MGFWPFSGVRYTSARTREETGQWVGLSTGDQTDDHDKHCKGKHRWHSTIVQSLWKCADCGVKVDVWPRAFFPGREIIGCPCAGCAPAIHADETLSDTDPICPPLPPL